MPMISVRSIARLDRAKMDRARHRAERKVLYRQGAYLRGVAKRSIKRRKNPLKDSTPGTPPHTHSGALKKSIMFAVGSDSVFIGPTRSGIGLIGSIHEFGGTEPRSKTEYKNNNWEIKVGGHGPIAMRGGGIH